MVNGKSEDHPACNYYMLMKFAAIKKTLIPTGHI